MYYFASRYERHNYIKRTDTVGRTPFPNSNKLKNPITCLPRTLAKIHVVINVGRVHHVLGISFGRFNITITFITLTVVKHKVIREL